MIILEGHIIDDGSGFSRLSTMPLRAATVPKTHPNTPSVMIATFLPTQKHPGNMYSHLCFLLSQKVKRSIKAGIQKANIVLASAPTRVMRSLRNGIAAARTAVV